MRTYEPSTEIKNNLFRSFTYHPPHGDQAQRYKLIRAQALHVALGWHNLAPPSEELKMAMIALEQAVFWMNAAIARNEATASPESEKVSAFFSHGTPSGGERK